LWAVPKPARFLIDRSDVIRSADVGPDYTRRTEPAETIKLVRAGSLTSQDT
jgi:hypothetical protein